MEPVTAMLLLGGANMLMGKMKADQAAKQREQEGNIRAAEIESAPFTGRGPSTQVATPSLNPWAEMAGGAINAMGQTAALQQAGLFKAGATPSQNTTEIDAGMPITKEEKMGMNYSSPNFYGRQRDLNQWQRMSNMANTKTGLDIF